MTDMAVVSEVARIRQSTHFEVFADVFAYAGRGGSAVVSRAYQRFMCTRNLPSDQHGPWFKNICTRIISGEIEVARKAD